MINDKEETDEVDDVPSVKPKVTPVIVLSLLLGILMTVVAVGSFFSYQRGKAVNAEVQALKKELIEKNRVHQDLQEQIEALSRQMAVLKDYSVARSSAAARVKEAVPDAKADVAVAVVHSAPPVAAMTPESGREKSPASLPAVQAPAVAPLPAPAKVKRSKPEGQSCELVGKSAEEQAAILKRCVGLMDSPKDARGGK